MAFIVEDGTQVASANAYITEAWLEQYAEDTGQTLASGNVEAAIVRASIWIDGRYGMRFPGLIYGRTQGLLWPRSSSYDRNGYLVAEDAVPIEIKRATAEAAIRELADPGALAPDVVASAGGAVKREKLGPLEVEYEAGTSAGATGPGFPVIDGILAPLLAWGGSSIPLIRA
jgi:hypothetical protein